MAKESAEIHHLPPHGAVVLPSVEVKSYNVEIEDSTGFLGDTASKGAFWQILDQWRNPLKDLGQDPLGDRPSKKIGKKRLAKILSEGEPEAAGVVHGAVEDYAQQLSKVIRRFLRLKEWRDSESLVIGGGFRASRIGELAIGRAAVLLKSDGITLDLEPIQCDPDAAGLLGAVRLIPAGMLDGYDAMLAVDIGGTNMRAGIVALDFDKSSGLLEARVRRLRRWRHADREVGRDYAVKRLVRMLKELIRLGRRDEVLLAPVIGIACPGVIRDDGSIERGAQNLPGNWESSRFKLPACICTRLPRIGDHQTTVVMHNDAVVQGLSAVPLMRDRRHWGVITIGTGLGNASFVNRRI